MHKIKFIQDNRTTKFKNQYTESEGRAKQPHFIVVISLYDYRLRFFNALIMNTIKIYLMTTNILIFSLDTS